MRIKRFSLLSLFLFWLFQPQITESIVLDRILAVVNGQIVSLSDVERELTFFDSSGFLPEGGKFSDAQLQVGIQRLVDQKLLLAEAKRFEVEAPTLPQIQEELEKIQKRFQSSAEFEKALRINTLSQEDMREKIKEHLIVDNFIDQRIRFFVIVLPDEISRYYSENPELFKGRSYEEVEKEIEKILFELKEKDKLEEYLSKVKKKASIQINFEAF